MEFGSAVGESSIQRHNISDTGIYTLLCIRLRLRTMARGMEAPKAYKKRIYVTFKTIFSAPDMRIKRPLPHSDGQTLWKNVTSAPITDMDRAVWCRAIHHILPTNEGMH